MHKFAKTLMLLIVLFSLSPAHAQYQQQELTGDVRLACEAVMCLASTIRPGECSPGLNRYFGISMRKFTDTIQARLDFLNLCPSSNQTPEMKALVQAMANGAGRCDATSLNATLLTTAGWDNFVYISDQMPSYCSIYTSHQYTDLTAGVPLYVGTPSLGGYWVERADYPKALAAYNAWLAARQNVPHDQH